MTAGMRTALIRHSWLLPVAMWDFALRMRPCFLASIMTMVDSRRLRRLHLAGAPLSGRVATSVLH